MDMEYSAVQTQTVPRVLRPESPEDWDERRAAVQQLFLLADKESPVILTEDSGFSATKQYQTTFKRCGLKKRDKASEMKMARIQKRRPIGNTPAAFMVRERPSTPGKTRRFCDGRQAGVRTPGNGVASPRRGQGNAGNRQRHPAVGSSSPKVAHYWAGLLSASLNQIQEVYRSMETPVISTSGTLSESVLERSYCALDLTGFDPAALARKAMERAAGVRLRAAPEDDSVEERVTDGGSDSYDSDSNDEAPSPPR